MTGTTGQPSTASPRDAETLRALQRRHTATLAAAGCVSADAEVRWLLEEVLDAEPGTLPLRNDQPVPAERRERLAAMVARRAAGEPLQYVIGWAPFGPLKLQVGPGVFVPRPETETLAERAAARLRAAGGGAVAVDLCTGSGPIACYLAHAVPGARVLATELEEAALVWARRNAERFGVEVLAGDLDAPLPAALAGLVDVLTVNPPYVPTGAIPLLPTDVRDHEPRGSLDGGADGLAVLRRVADRAGRWLRPGGHLLSEIGDDQAAQAVACLRAAGLGRATIRPDLVGRDRVVEATWM